MATEPQSWAALLEDAGTMALNREALRVAKLDLAWAALPSPKLPTEGHRAQAVYNLKHRIVAMLVWRP
jgi:hypothetical protein